MRAAKNNIADSPMRRGNSVAKPNNAAPPVTKNMKVNITMASKIAIM